MNINLTFFVQALAFLIVPALGLGVLILVVRSFFRRSRPDRRLSELDALLAKGTVTAEEHARQRASIIAGV